MTTKSEAIASIDADIAALNEVLATLTHMHLERASSPSLEQAIGGIGGEIAWLHYKRKEAEKYLSDTNTASERLLSRLRG